MSLFGVYYEFQVNETNVRRLVEDIGITQRRAPAVIDVAQNLLDLVGDKDAYAKVEVDDRPGILLRFSRKFEAEGLPHSIEGAHVFVHPSSEGYLELSDFKRYFEASLSRWQIPFKRYDGSRDRM